MITKLLAFSAQDFWDNLIKKIKPSILKPPNFLYFKNDKSSNKHAQTKEKK